MKLTKNAGRLLAAGGAMACAAILLPASALATSAASGSPAHPDGVPRCVNAHPTFRGGAFVWLGLPGNGFTGGVVYALEMTNTGRHACTLRGSPRVAAVTGQGSQVGKSAGGGKRGPLVTLPPGATAHAVLTVRAPNCPHPIRANVVAYLPGQTVSQGAQISGGFCRHVAQLGIDAIHHGTGIPLYTIH